MLSTRRRRILHIAADSWEAGGGKAHVCASLLRPDTYILTWQGILSEEYRLDMMLICLEFGLNLMASTFGCLSQGRLSLSPG